MADAGKNRAAVEEYLRNNPQFVKAWVTNNVAGNELSTWVDGSSKTNVPSQPAEGQGAQANMFKDFVDGKRPIKPSGVKRTKDELLAMDQMDLFMELIRDITNELDVNILCHKILINVGMLTHSDRGSLFLTKKVGTKSYLVSKLFDVTEKAKFKDVLHTEENEIVVPFGVGIAGAVAQSKGHINIKNAYEDPRFNKEVDKKTGYRTKSILCMPILDYDGQVLGIAQIMNKTDDSDEFSPDDEKVFRNYLSFCGIGLANAQLFEMSVLEYKRNRLLLSLARNIFEVQSNLDDLIRKIILDAQHMLKAERCTVWLVADIGVADGDTFAKHQQALDNLRGVSKKTKRVLQMSDSIFDRVYEHHAGCNGEILSPPIKDVGGSEIGQLAAEVAVNGEAHNIGDARLDDRFQREIKAADGHKVISTLAVPIKNGEHHVIGVVQLVNKDNNKPFNANDLNNLEAFAIFCGLGINNCQMYESVCKLMAKQQVSLEVLSYHASASLEEAQKLLQSRILSVPEYKLDTYEFDDLLWNDDDTCRATVRMFLANGIHEAYNVPIPTLCRWILSVKKNYRPVTYHNWRHAFNVAQSMFTILTAGKLTKIMDTLEVFGLLVACLCHDLDHRGTNNAFQSKAESPLATLYGTSTMEHHHFDQCIMILNSEGNNIFGSLKQEDYKKVIKLVESCILSTDLALYFRKKNPFMKLVEQGNTDWNRDEHKELLRGMMMTACDVAAITKPWEIQERVAHLVADEFFEQGDFEKEKLGLDPIAMMDRKMEDELPKMQVGFIDAICLPLYQLMTDTFEDLHPLLDGCMQSRDLWSNKIVKEPDTTKDSSSKKEGPGLGRNNKVEPQATEPSESGTKRKGKCSCCTCL